MPQAFVHRSRRFAKKIVLRSSSSEDFSGTAKSGRKIKQRRVCGWHLNNQQKMSLSGSIFFFQFSDMFFQNDIDIL